MGVAIEETDVVATEVVADVDVELPSRAWLKWGWAIAFFGKG